MAAFDNVLNFVREGEMALEDIGFSIREGFLSTSLPRAPSVVYLNITTKEGETFCVKLDPSGFQVVGHSYDTEDHQGTIYETVYALLENISPSYVQQFSLQLSQKLSKLQQQDDK